MGRERVAVIGGGIVGCTAAALMAEAGRSVTLVEATAIAAGASGRNSGTIQHPFDEVLLELHVETLAMYRELAENDRGFAFPDQPAGILLLTDDPDAAERRAAELTTSYPDLRPEVLGPTEAAVAEPALAPGWAAVRLATGYPAVPDAATHAMAARAVRAGAVVRIGREARPWVENDAVGGVILDDGERIPAVLVLVAAGPWTPELLGDGTPWPPISRTWGVTAQVRLAKPPHHVLEEGVVHTINAPTGATDSLFSLVAVGEVATVGSTFVTEQPDPEVIGPELVRRGSAFVPALIDAPIVANRLCARPQSFDGRPFIGPARGEEGLFVCAGHGPWGMSTGPASAAMVVDQMLGATDRVPAALRADRA